MDDYGLGMFGHMQIFLCHSKMRKPLISKEMNNGNDLKLSMITRHLCVPSEPAVHLLHRDEIIQVIIL